MKKIAVFLMAVIIASAAGCAKKSEETTKVPPTIPSKSTNVPAGIAYNKIIFENVKEGEMPSGMQASVNANSKSRGFVSYEDKSSGYIYTAIFMGQCRSGGYSIKVVNVGDSEGITEVIVKEEKPAEGSIVTMALTYPSAIVRMKGVTPNVVVKNEKGEQFAKLQ